MISGRWDVKVKYLWQEVNAWWCNKTTSLVRRSSSTAQQEVHEHSWTIKFTSFWAVPERLTGEVVSFHQAKNISSSKFDIYIVGNYESYLELCINCLALLKCLHLQDIEENKDSYGHTPHDLPGFEMFNNSGLKIKMFLPSEVLVRGDSTYVAARYTEL